MIDLAIIDYAKKCEISFKDGETFGEIYSRIIEHNPSLHSREELQKISDILINQIKNKFGLTELYVFAQYPYISTKEYHGFEEVYLYKHILEFMKDFTQAFCEKYQINEIIRLEELKNKLCEILDEYGCNNVYERTKDLWI